MAFEVDESLFTLPIPVKEQLPTDWSWEKKEKVVLDLFLKENKKASEIIKETGIPSSQVVRILRHADVSRRALAIQESIKRSIFRDKAPVLEAVADLGLVALIEWLQTFIAKGQHKKMTPKEAKSIVEMIEKVDSMWRLTVGKSTQNIAIKQLVMSAENNLKTIVEQLNKPIEEGGDPFGPRIEVEVVK